MDRFVYLFRCRRLELVSEIHEFGSRGRRGRTIEGPDRDGLSEVGPLEAGSPLRWFLLDGPERVRLFEIFFYPRVWSAALRFCYVLEFFLFVGQDALHRLAGGGAVSESLGLGLERDLADQALSDAHSGRVTAELGNHASIAAGEFESRRQGWSVHSLDDLDALGGVDPFELGPKVRLDLFQQASDVLDVAGNGNTRFGLLFLSAG